MDHGRAVETERLKEEMADSRASIAETVEELRGAVSQAMDWREQVKAHPGASLGIVAGAGVVLGHWLGGKMVSGEHPRAATPAAAPSQPQAAGLLDGSLNRAGTRMESLVNRVIDEVADAVETAAIVPLFTRLRGFLRTRTGATREDTARTGFGSPAGVGPTTEPRPGAAEVAWRSNGPGNGGSDR